MIRIVVEDHQFRGNRLTLTPEQEHYLFRVMRAGPGTSFEAIVSGTKLFRCVTAEIGGLVQCVGTREVSQRVPLYLAQALLKKDLFSEIVEKGTEAGISRFYPVLTERTIVREISDTKWKRWHSIAKEATEQSQGDRVPNIFPATSLRDLLTVEATTKVMLDAQGKNIWDWVRKQSKAEFSECLLAVGPEGGFTESEREFLTSHGFEVVSLGPYVYRAENAGVFAAVVLTAWQASAETTGEIYEMSPEFARDGDDF
ncbi:MAG: 16S rRNA (uracil(1498)-N(3))-methyltransferase [Firmicutes bacterium]|jgi:16S rRNA (uracil1498-N3)-methyltransferase|nr:16S rRNA (uracil(1498)-N(3))-methyltransferase [Bacillota bacterium]MCL5013644.1 16S rRNA (uracil(1498)-N(3))-methyltransferase [Bacillota bacterium]